MMASVTKRINQIKQPFGGYVPLKKFQEHRMDDNQTLCSEESIYPNIVGLAVDYLARWLYFKEPLENVLRVSKAGSVIVGEIHNWEKLKRKMQNANQQAQIKIMCQLAAYDCAYRAGIIAFKPTSEIKADERTIINIKIMLERSIKFFEQNGPIMKSGFTFEGGYTSLINSGDGDYLTCDTLWDMKTSKNRPKSADTLQILVYYLMGIHSIHKEFVNIQYLGIFNPRQNLAYKIRISDISPEVIEKVSMDIIGYKNNEIINYCKSQQMEEDERWTERKKGLDKYMMDWK